MAQRALVVQFIGDDKDLSNAFKRVGTQVSGLEATARRVSSVGSTLTRGLTVPIVGIGVVAAKAAVDFQRSMETIRTQAGASQKQVDALSKGVLNLAGQVGEAPNTLAQGMYHVVSSLNATLPAAKRVSTEMQVLKVAAEGAKTGHADLVDVTNALDAAIVSGIKGVQNYQQAMGALNATVGAGDMTMQDLADALGTGLLAPMKTYGLTLKDVSGALAVFGDNNIRGQDAATKLISAVRIMAAPSKLAAKALGDINLSTLQLATDMRQGGLIQALSDLKQHLIDSGDSAEQQGLVIARAFGGRQSTGVQVLLNQMDRLKAKVGEVGTGAKTFGQDWTATQKTAAQQTAQMLAKIQADAVRFGNDVLPNLLNVGDKVVNDVDRVAHAFESLPGGVKQAIVTGGLLLATVGPALKILGAFTSGITKIYALAAGTKGLGGGGAGAGAGAVSAASKAETAGLGATFVAGLSRAVGIGALAIIAAPFGIELGKVVDKWINTQGEKEGDAWAKKFTKSLPGHISEAASKGLGKAVTQVARAGTPGSELATVRTGGNPFAKILSPKNPGGGNPLLANPAASKVNPAAFNASFNKQFDAIYAAVKKAGKIAGGDFVNAWQGVKFPSEPILIASMKQHLNDVPKAIQKLGPGWVQMWKDLAGKQMLQYAESLQAQGKLPVKALNQLIHSLEGQIPGFDQYLTTRGLATDQALAKTLKFNSASAALKSTLANYRKEFGDTDISLNITGQNINQNMTTAMSHLKKIIASSSGDARKAAVAEFKKMHDESAQLMSSMTAKVSQAAKDMQGYITSSTSATAKAAAGNLAGLASAIYNAVKSGALNSKQGLSYIQKAFNATLKAYGATQIPEATLQAVALSSPFSANVGAFPKTGVGGGGKPAGAARGALMQIGRPGQAGHDSVGMNVGGIPIKVAPGEQVAVFNRHQIPEVNAALSMRGYAGLSGLFNSIRTPNYMASGGLVGPAADSAQRAQGLALMQQIWSVARGFYPGADGLPATHFLKNFPIVGDARNPSGARAGQYIAWPDWMNKWLIGKKAGQRSAAEETLVHEWAHYFQSQKTANGGEWMAEGGAQAFTREHAAAIMGAAGLPFGLESRRDDVYFPFVQKVRKKLGEGWINKGQFQGKALGGMVPRFAAGGTFTYGQLEGLWDRAGGSSGMAALMAAIAEAESGGNSRAFNPSGASGLWQILGLPFPGNVFDPLTNARMAVAKLQSQGLGAWATYTSGAYRAFLQGGVPAASGPLGALAAAISAPKVTGGGTLGNLLKAGLGKVASAANTFVGKLAPSAGLSGRGGGAVGPTGGGFDPSQLTTFDGVTVAKWIARELIYGRGHGWSGPVTSGYRAGFDPHTVNGFSEHSLDIYPGGAVDFGGMIDPAAAANRAAFMAAVAGYPSSQRLIPPIGFRDDGHMSGTGHARGGMLPFGGIFDSGGVAPGRPGQPSLAVLHGGETVIPTGGLTTIVLSLSKAATALQQIAGLHKSAATGGAGLTAGKATLAGFFGLTGSALPQGFVARSAGALAGIGAAGLGAAPKLTLSGLINSLGHIPSQGIRGQIQAAQLGNQLQLAQNANDTAGQQKALQATMKLEQGWLSADQGQLKRVNKALRKRGLSRKQRGRLLQDKLGLLQEIGTVESDIGSAQTQLSDLTSAASDTSGGGAGSADTGISDAQQAAIDAQNALTDAINAETQAMSGLKASLDANVQYMKSVGAVETSQAIKALSDVISGDIGGRYLSRATGSAGDGTVVRY